MRLRYYTYVFLLLLCNAGVIFAQAFPYPQFYPGVYDDPLLIELYMQESAPLVRPPESQIEAMQPPLAIQRRGPRFYSPGAYPIQAPSSLVDQRRGPRVYRPEMYTNGYYSRRAYDQAILEIALNKNGSSKTHILDARR